MISASVPLVFAALAAGSPNAANAAGAAEKKPGTFFLVELQTGLAESPYGEGSPALTYGLAAGLTWKWKALPLRFHLLTGLTARGGQLAGQYRGIPYSAERQDVDLYLAHRLALPIWGPIRIYGEAGLGHRWATHRVRRSGALGSLSTTSDELVVILAAGVQARLTRHISAGVRLEALPLDSAADIVSATTGVESTTNRLGVVAQLGLHF